MPTERLQKVLASGGVASRRASEALIAAGRVTVDGRVARPGEQVDPEQARIEVDGRPIGGPTARLHLALHKPMGVTATVHDPHAERAVLQLLPTALVSEAGRLYPVGRLDRESEGLLLLTNDGPWAERVLHPRYGVDREYAVGLRSWLANDQRAALDGGMDLEEGRAAFAQRLRPASQTETSQLRGVLDPPADGLVWYRVVLRQGWKRQVRRMFGAVGVPIVRLVRVRIGNVRLGDLESGRYRRLQGREVQSLGSGAPAQRAPTAAPGARRGGHPPTAPGAGRSGPSPTPRRPGGRKVSSRP